MLTLVDADASMPMAFGGTLMWDQGQTVRLFFQSTDAPGGEVYYYNFLTTGPGVAYAPAPGPGVVGVPEPGTLILLAGGLLGLGVFRRRFTG